MSGRLSAVELMNRTLERIDAVNGELNAIVTLDADTALRSAAAADDVRSGFAPLHGLPFTVKDSIEVAGLRTTAGSRLLHSNVASQSATTVRRLTAAGAIVIGKSNCPEFGVGDLDTDNLIFGRTRNPHDPARTPGGSSGGESAAVAAGLSAFGVGTDYGGSVRWPAHCTGLAALRPTPGTVPSDGSLPHAPIDGSGAGARSDVQRELQTVGFLARSVEDLSVLLDVARGRRPDRPSAESATPRCSWFADGVDPEIADAVRRAAGWLADAGLDVVEGLPPGFARAAPLLAELRAAEGLPEIERLSAGRRDELTQLVRTALLTPQRAPRAGLAADVAAVRGEVARFLQTRPILIMPAGGAPAFVPELTPGPRSGLEAHNRAVTLLRLPAVVVPVGRSRTGLPIGVQLAGRPGADDQVLAVARALQTAARFSLRTDDREAHR